MTIQRVTRRVRDVLGDFLFGGKGGAITRHADRKIIGRISDPELLEAIAIVRHSICSHPPRPADRPLGDVSVAFRPPAPMSSEHLDGTGKFQSDKYPWCMPDFVPLKVTDADAWLPLWLYANRRASIDAAFAADLKARLRAAGFKPETIFDPKDI